MSRTISSQGSRNLSLQLNYVPYRQKDHFLSPKLSKISSRTNLSYKPTNPPKNIETIPPNQQKIVCPQPQKPIPIPIQQKNISQQKIIVKQSQGIDEIDIFKIQQLISDKQVHQQNKIVQQPSQTTDHFDEYKIIQASNQDQEQQFTFHQNQINLEELQQQEKIVQVPKIIITQVKKERFTNPVNKIANMPHKFLFTKSTKIGSPKNFKPIFKTNSNAFVKPIPNMKNQKQQKFTQIMNNLKTSNKLSISNKLVVKKQLPKRNKLLMRFKKKKEQSNQ